MRPKANVPACFLVPPSLFIEGSAMNNKYIIENLRGKQEYFKDIEKVWKVYIPFNKGDLMRYKE